MTRFVKEPAIRNAVVSKTGRLAQFFAKAGVPAHVLCATGDDHHRKPGAGMFHHFERECNTGQRPHVIASLARWPWTPPSHSTGASVDKAASFYVGDAAGREKDHSDSDLLFAKAAGLRFFTEDAFFDSSAQHPLWMRHGACAGCMVAVAGRLAPAAPLPCGAGNP
jgi:bifunctional polynucleotide phosphatase/kinase